MERANNQADLVFSNTKLMNDMKNELSSATVLRKPTEEGNNKLVKLGLLILASPDPFSDPIGIGLILVGVVKNKMKRSTIFDAPNELRKSVNELSKMKREVQHLL